MDRWTVDTSAWHELIGPLARFANPDLRNSFNTTNQYV